MITHSELQVASVPVSGGFALIRANNPLRTPELKPLIVPTLALAEAIEAEWAGQGERINKALLKLTPIACVAVDIASDNRNAVLGDVVPYIDTDLVCYRAGEIEALQQQQNELLEPILAWAKERFGIALVTTGGLMPVAQSPHNSRLLTNILAAYDDWKLAAFSVAVKPLGSAVLALALVEGRLRAQDAFILAHLEEAYETQKWGEDEEKEKFLSTKKEEVYAVELFLNLLKG